jgi:hypothetical protein
MTKISSYQIEKTIRSQSLSEKQPILCIHELLYIIMFGIIEIQNLFVYGEG